tara:strand:- start:4626 stop:4913 length:288 start_codon:yes stop_codon:yes gene_type:complete
MKTFYQLRAELPEDTSEVEIMPEINSDTDDPKELTKKAMKRLLPKKKKLKKEEATLATARKNIGKDPKKASCWKGYKATGTKMKGGKSVPDCKPK